jgi:hypothetical protein
MDSKHKKIYYWERGILNGLGQFKAHEAKIE